MTVKIVADSSCDMTEEMRKELDVEIVPLTLQIGDKIYTDDEHLDIQMYLKDMKEYAEAPKTSCPSPQQFMKAYEGKESVFVVTLSSALSGTYNSAVLAKNMFLEEVGEKFIHVFNSFSACVGETLISFKISDLAKKNINEWEIVEKVTKYIEEMKTFFLLESLENLSKAGRLHPVIAKIANVLSIKPIMGSTDDGHIRLVHKARGYKRAFQKFIDTIGEEGTNLEEKVLGIAHCNCLNRALDFKKEVQKRYNFKEIIIVEMAGLSSTYANDGGLVIAF
ncbi:MAG: DegV family protein [Epulopiscium sp.]|nr:DegV family protein [Candidatus Epulonipiscium sp.]